MFEFKELKNTLYPPRGNKCIFSPTAYTAKYFADACFILNGMPNRTVFVNMETFKEVLLNNKETFRESLGIEIIEAKDVVDTSLLAAASINKTPAKNPVAKKAPAKNPVAKNPVAKKAPAKKAPAKKAAVKKEVTKK